MRSSARSGCYARGVARAPAAAASAAGPVIYGTGVDLLHISRMAKVYERHPQRLVQRMLHPLERARFDQARDPVNFLAKSFAVKEAFVKALGTGFRGMAHDDVGWTRVPLGPPQLCVSPRAAAMLAARGIGAMHLSLSDEVDLVCAVVTLERQR
ncbi:holo-[acyl-carrier protein] synthase [Hydrocarboniphaga daqingensis]|uniref:Holo-[acyl-carrier-protein] synthase n=1 Tax=Hydrocarboniphaga daqingensis TaxID=490188 RepID=A0A1M5KK79_9GAMM|nr:holo-ACP synthase [Hydrocarboniphaga daqingensis]SHG52583.1 holo-[acyl-carrier protein] synthase [Hydrocarboniphaga daqingensis]